MFKKYEGNGQIFKSESNVDIRGSTRIPLFLFLKQSTLPTRNIDEFRGLSYLIDRIRTNTNYNISRLGSKLFYNFHTNTKKKFSTLQSRKLYLQIHFIWQLANAKHFHRDHKMLDRFSFLKSVLETCCYKTF